MMCVFLTLRLNKAQVKKQYDTLGVDNLFFGPYYVQSAFSFSKWPVISSKNPEYVSMMNWGLIPHWVKDEEAAKKIRASTVNARIETIGEKPSFRKAVKSSRCLVLTDGFYEYRELNRMKYPYFIQMANAEPFAMAGIYDEWVSRESGELINSFSIVTTEANELMSKIHNRKKRMPVILKEDMRKDWLSFKIDPRQLRQPLPSEFLESWTVSKAFNRRDGSGNSPDVIAPYEYPELAMLDGMGM